MGAWRATRRQAAAHAAILATLFRGATHSLMALSIHPAGASGRLKRRYDDPTANCFRACPRNQ